MMGAVPIKFLISERTYRAFMNQRQVMLMLGKISCPEEVKYIPWEREARKKLLFGEKGFKKNQLKGYFTEREIRQITEE